MRAVLCSLATLSIACAAAGSPDDEDLLQTTPQENTIDVPLFPENGWLGIPDQCTQSYPPSYGANQRPWVWGSARSQWFETNHPCRYGCTLTPDQPTASSGAVEVSLAHDGAIEVRRPSQAWHTVLPAAGLEPVLVRFTSWCRDSIVVVAHDGRTLRAVALGTEDGAVLDHVERPLTDDGSVDPAFDLQLTCWDLHTAIHTRGSHDAWTLTVPTHSADPTPAMLPPPVFAWLSRWPALAVGDPVDRERAHTSTREYQRVKGELFALDPHGSALWHREATDEDVGCMPHGLRIIAGGHSDWRPKGRLSIADGYVMLTYAEVASGVDVFDEDGEHIAHLAR